MKKQMQQGDVWIEATAIPNDAKKISPVERGYVLAYGEVTGHAHVLEEIENIEMYELNGLTYIRVKKPTRLVHEEHNPITLPKGEYQFGQISEFDHFTEEARKVAD